MKKYRPTKSFLQSAWERHCKVYPAQRQLGTLRDAYGVYAYVCEGTRGRYLFCAKNSQKGDEVSCHKDLVLQAQREHLRIYMYIGKKLYRFFAYDIIASDFWVNQFHGAEMYNFALKVGMNVDNIGKHRSSSSPVVADLFDQATACAQSAVRLSIYMTKKK